MWVQLWNLGFYGSLSPLNKYFFVLFVCFSESVAQRVHGPMLLSHNLTYLSLLLFYLRGKTLTRGAQMCETFYCKSGQTSQISGKFRGGLKAALGPKTLESECFFIVVWMEEKRQNSVILSPD